ncbi:MAG: DEAD/DEAH box helicase [Sediminicola sp.]|tara:strand:+ start:52599 stop:53213 length:615 start_codon:yes stop_codon:yes gene_type:complete
MSFKKIHPILQENLLNMGLKSPNQFQKELISKIKAGTGFFGIGPAGSGKTTAMIIGVIQKLNAAAFEDSPRALIFVKDKESALELAQKFREFAHRTDLRVYCAYEEHNIELQREEIYLGTDVVIATPKRLAKLFYLNGIHLGQLQMFIVEDAEFLSKASDYSDVIRIPESMERCQYIVLAEEWDNRMDRMANSFMYNAVTITEN